MIDSMKLIDDAIKFKHGKVKLTRTRIGDWFQSMDNDGLIDLQERLTELIVENQSDDYVCNALVHMKEYVTAEQSVRVTAQGMELFGDAFKKLVGK